jgi:hypothetical protein
MKTRIITMGGMLVLIGLLAFSCAPRSTVSTTMSPNPFYGDSWWGSDPVCSPGCPSNTRPGW